jgi:drug/metabolite transporter (DMT)-like permease
MQSTFASGVALALLAVLIWGAQFPIAKSTFATVDPFHVSAIRYALGTLLLGGFVVWRDGTAALRYYGRAWPASVLGVVGMTGSPMLVFGGLALTRPEHAAIIVALQPSITAIADWWLHGRRPARFTLGCMAAAFAGVVLVVTKGDPALQLGRGELTGDLLVLAGAVCWVPTRWGPRASAAGRRSSSRCSRSFRDRSAWRPERRCSSSSVSPACRPPRRSARSDPSSPSSRSAA